MSRMPSKFVRQLFAAALLIVCALPAGAAPAQGSGGEQLMFIMPEGWQEYASDRIDNMSTTEYVPEGQASEEWDDMFTVQIMVATTELEPEHVLVAVARRAENFCEGFDVQPIELGGVGRHRTMSMMMLCGKNKQTGRGEFMLLRGIAGDENFYLLQRSWRVPAFDIDDAPPVSLEERKFWLGYMAYLRVCDERKENCQAPTPE